MGGCVGADDLVYRVLGPLQVARAGVVQEVPGDKLRRLLALLVLHAGHRVTDDVIVETLWPASPPPTASDSVRVHVSRLRRILGDGVVLRDARGYLLVAPPAEVDARVFESLVDTARSAREDDVPRALACYREAEELWRGAVACDVGFDGPPPEAARLEELRVVAIEERLEVALAAGEGPTLVPELEALVAAHPFRERLRAQLMLALYAGGRQAEALAAYRDARGSFRAELGIEPGPELRRLERRILVQDPTLPGAEPARVARMHRRSRVAAFAGAAAAAVAAVVALGLTLGGAQATGPGDVVPDSLVELDAATGAVRSVTPLPEGPDAIAVTDDALWVTSVAARTVARVDRGTGAVDVLGGVQAAGDIVATAAGAIWVGGLGAGVVTLVDAAEGDFRSARPSVAVPGGAISLVAAPDTLWVTVARDESRPGEVVRVDPATRRVRGSTDVGVFPASVAVARGIAWIANYGDGTVSAIDRRGRAMETIPVGRGPITVAADDRAVWVGLFWENELVRIDPARRAVVARVRVGRGLWGIAVDRSSVWVANRDSSTISRIDRRTNRLVSTIHLAAPPYGVAVVDGRLWVTTQRCPSPNVPCDAR